MVEAAAPRYFRTSAAFRRWLEANHARQRELRVAFYKKGSGRTGITYPEAVDEALCFGWIDGVLGRVDEASYAIRFTPRGPRSTWSDRNTKRVGELRKAGRMAPSGLAAFARRDPARSGLYSFENRVIALSPAYTRRLRAAPKAKAFFEAQPPGYRRTATFWVMSAVKEETRERRLAMLIADSAAGRAIKPLRQRPAPPSKQRP